MAQNGIEHRHVYFTPLAVDELDVVAPETVNSPHVGPKSNSPQASPFNPSLASKSDVIAVYGRYLPSRPEEWAILPVQIIASILTGTTLLALVFVIISMLQRFYGFSLLVLFMTLFPLGWNIFQCISAWLLRSRPTLSAVAFWGTIPTYPLLLIAIIFSFSALSIFAGILLLLTFGLQIAYAVLVGLCIRRRLESCCGSEFPDHQ